MPKRSLRQALSSAHQKAAVVSTKESSDVVNVPFSSASQLIISGIFSMTNQLESNDLLLEDDALQLISNLAILRLQTKKLWERLRIDSYSILPDASDMESQVRLHLSMI